MEYIYWSVHFQLHKLDNMKLSREILLLTITFTISHLLSCDNNVKTYGDCEFVPQESCEGFGFSFVNADTYENLMGTDGQLIHPDSVVITNTRNDQMYHNPFKYTDGWYIIEWFNPFQEIKCFNQCISDSAFTRTYYIYIGNGDTDTMEVYFPTRSPGPEVFFNGSDARVPLNELPDSLGVGRSSYWFRKKVN